MAEEKVAVCIQHILPKPLILSCVCGEILIPSLVGRMALKFCSGLIYLLCFDVLLSVSLEWDSWQLSFEVP